MNKGLEKRKKNKVPQYLRVKICNSGPFFRFCHKSVAGWGCTGSVLKLWLIRMALPHPAGAGLDVTVVMQMRPVTACPCCAAGACFPNRHQGNTEVARFGWGITAPVGADPLYLTAPGFMKLVSRTAPRKFPFRFSRRRL